MVFGNQFGSFFGNHGLLEDPHEKLKHEYNALIEEYKILSAEHKKVKSKNDRLLKEIDDLKEDARKFKEHQEESKNHMESLIRIQADYENYRKISERENLRFRANVKEEMIKKLINHYDDLIRTQKIFEDLQVDEAVKKGFNMMLINFEKLLTEEHVEPMNCQGEKFDPYKHEALMVKESELPENTILEELHQGYYLNNKVIRPAKVIISKNS